MKYVLLVFINKEELRGTQCNKLKDTDGTH